MKKLHILPLVVLTFFSCYVGACQSSNPTEQTTAVVEEQFEEALMEVIYEGAAVYAGRTDYVFKNTTGHTMTIGVSNMPEDAATSPKVPANMLESGDDIEGPPGANPELVGKAFYLVYAAGGDRLLAIRAKE